MALECKCAGVVDYWEKRKEFLEEEKRAYLGSELLLNENESKVNEILMKHKKKELDDSFQNPSKCPAANHFFKVKKQIEESQVFKFLKKMPKASILHIHDTGCLPPNYIINNVLNRDNLYGRLNGSSISFVFTDKPGKDWAVYEKLKKDFNNDEDFLRVIKSNLSLEVEDPETSYPDINAVWTKFGNLFETVMPLINYKPVFEDYYYDLLKSCYEDNVTYMELRSTLPEVYELDGSKLLPEEAVGLLKKCSDRFTSTHPDFIGMKIIYAPHRMVDDKTMNDYLEFYQILKELYPDFLIGFDLVGQEDPGEPLAKFADKLNTQGSHIQYFFHAAETNWNGMPSDMNIIDAVLLKTKRIGHGYAILKHPKVMEEVKKQNICIEINPISNQVLMLVKDLRNHPGSVLMAHNYPLVISCDDPGFWGIEGLSYDFYMAFMAMANYEADLRFLKQLALNSIKYTALNDKDKNRLQCTWEEKWDDFINTQLNEE